GFTLFAVPRLLATRWLRRQQVAHVFFRTSIGKVGKMLDAAKDPNDPAVLLVAYFATADAFERLGDRQEAINWQHKAGIQIQKMTHSSKPIPTSADNRPK